MKLEEKLEIIDRAVAETMMKLSKLIKELLEDKSPEGKR